MSLLKLSWIKPRAVISMVIARQHCAMWKLTSAITRDSGCNVLVDVASAGISPRFSHDSAAMIETLDCIRKEEKTCECMRPLKHGPARQVNSLQFQILLLL